MLFKEERLDLIIISRDEEIKRNNYTVNLILNVLKD